MDAFLINDSNLVLSSSPIEEIWLIRDGICIFHDFYTDKPLNLNIQLFSAFTTAVSSFSRNTLPSEQLRNIDFQNTTLVLEPLPEFSILFVIKFSSLPPEKQVEIINFILEDIKVFINYEANELFSLDQKSILPLNAYTKPLTEFFRNFISNLTLNEKAIRKIDLLSILQIAENLFTLISKSVLNFKYSELDSLDLDNVFNSIIFSNNLSTDTLPTLSRRDLKIQFQDFLNNLRLIIQNDQSEKKSLQNILFEFFIENYKLIKNYDLDEPFVLQLLTVFHEKYIVHEQKRI